MRWLIEKGIFTETEEKLAEVLKDKGIETKFMSYVPFDKDVASRAKEIYPKEKDVVFYGSLNFAIKLRELGWQGLFANYEKYDCLSYYPVFKDNLLNGGYFMLPFGDLLNKRDTIFELFDEDKVFIRPNSVLKEFTGQVVSKLNFEEAVKVMGFYETPPNSLVIVSSLQYILREYRFVIINGEVVTGSLYHDFGNSDKVLNLPCEDRGAIEYAQKMAKLYNPDPVWILDICYEHRWDSYKVLEIGCFSFAGLYGCDLGVIVDEIGKIL
jgi:hypothetical protein